MNFKAMPVLYLENESEMYKKGDRVRIETTQGANMTGEISDIFIDDNYECKSKIWLNDCVYIQLVNIKSVEKVSFNNK